MQPNDSIETYAYRTSKEKINCSNIIKRYKND